MKRLYHNKLQIFWKNSSPKRVERVLRMERMEEDKDAWDKDYDQEVKLKSGAGTNCHDPTDREFAAHLLGKVLADILLS